MNIDTIKLKIDDHECISFDLFDTLLKRYVIKPKDIFTIVEDKIVDKFGEKYGKFSEKRVLSERNLRTSYSVFGEVTLSQIYQEMRNEFSEEVLSWAEQVELELEYKLCGINYELLPVYQYALEKKKLIAITTDIYLSKKFIEKLLKKIGITKYDFLFVSSEVNKTKNAGDLFGYAQEKMGISFQQILHIGDNKHSDYDVPRKLGIDAYLIHTESMHRTYSGVKMKQLGDQLAYKFINEKLLNEDESKRLGYECMGPMLYGFSRWIEKEIQKLEITDVFFFSRDGFILKKAFDELIHPEIRSHYFYTSRRALQVPYITENITYESFIDHVHWPRVVSIPYFLKAVGIECEEVQKIVLEKIEVSKEYFVLKESLKKDTCFHRVWDGIQEIILLESRDELDNLLGYIKQEGLIGKVAIVDIGWHGNMQRNLEQILCQNNIVNEVHGFYIGITPKDNHQSIINMKGYLFETGKNEELYKEEISINGMFEQIFLAPHGSVKRYVVSDGTFYPLLYPNEQTDDNSKEILFSYQDGALDFVRDFAEVDIGYLLSKEFSVDAILKQFMYPTIKDASNWRNVHFMDTDDYKLIENRGLKYYLSNPKSFINDYHRSFWKEGFLKITFIKDINYHQIVLMLKSIREITILVKKGIKRQ